MERNYHVVSGRERGAERVVAAFCQTNGQVLLPLVELAGAVMRSRWTFELRRPS